MTRLHGHDITFRITIYLLLFYEILKILLIFYKKIIIFLTFIEFFTLIENLRSSQKYLIIMNFSEILLASNFIKID